MNLWLMNHTQDNTENNLVYLKQGFTPIWVDDSSSFSEEWCRWIILKRQQVGRLSIWRRGIQTQHRDVLVGVYMGRHAVGLGTGRYHHRTLLGMAATPRHQRYWVAEWRSQAIFLSQLLHLESRDHADQ